jgi:hypothetical protein
MAFTALLASALPGLPQDNAGGDAGGASAVSGPEQLAEDLSTFFKKSCEPHWVGQITSTFRYEQGGTKKTFDRAGGDIRDVTKESSWSTRLENKIQALLQDSSRGAAERDQPLATVVHRFEYRDEYSSTASFSIWCREEGRNPRVRETTTRSGDLDVEVGEDSSEEEVSAYVEPGSGKYTITVSYPATRTRWHRERMSRGVDGCQDRPPKVEVSDGEGGTPISEEYLKSGHLEVTGKVDPANADTLSGERVTGDLESGQNTTTWNLRRVKPASPR